MAARFLDFHPRAVVEARKARNWYAKRSPAVASRFMAEFDRAVERILEGPEQWPKHILGTRHVKLRRFPYLIIYQLGPIIRVIAVAHGRRRPGFWRKRLS